MNIYIFERDLRPHNIFGKAVNASNCVVYDGFWIQRATPSFFLAPHDTSNSTTLPTVRASAAAGATGRRRTASKVRKGRPPIGAALVASRAKSRRDRACVGRPFPSPDARLIRRPDGIQPPLRTDLRLRPAAGPSIVARAPRSSVSAVADERRAPSPGPPSPHGALGAAARVRSSSTRDSDTQPLDGRAGSAVGLGRDSDG